MVDDCCNRDRSAAELRAGRDHSIFQIESRENHSSRPWRWRERDRQEVRWNSSDHVASLDGRWPFKMLDGRLHVLVTPKFYRCARAHSSNFWRRFATLIVLRTLLFSLVVTISWNGWMGSTK
jgi:hypothetical protein